MSFKNRIEQNFLEDLQHQGDFKPSNTGDVQKIRGKANLIQALLHRLITVKGALAHRPNYGVGVQKFLGAPQSIDKQRQLALEVKNQFEQDPRVNEVTGVQIIPNETNPSIFQLKVKVDAQGAGEFIETFDPFEVIYDN